MIRLINIILITLCLSACSGKQYNFSSQQEFDEYLNDIDNGFIQSYESNDLLFEARLIPALKNEKETQFTIQLRISRLDGFAVLETGNASKQEALTREGYLSFELLDDIEIEFDGKTEKPVFHHYERNYGIKPSVDILFNFDNIKPNSEVSFIYRDQIFNQGLIKLKFKKELFTSCHVQD